MGKILTNKKIISVALLFIFIWLILTCIKILTTGDPLTVLASHGKLSDFNAQSSLEEKEGKIQGSFIAKSNNLGIVVLNIKVNKEDFTDRDTITFKIKENNSNEWYYEAARNQRFIDKLSHYPFGFPLIKDSDGKKYDIELVYADDGSQNPTVMLDGQTLISKYAYDKKELFSDSGLLTVFLSKKIVWPLMDFDFFYFSLATILLCVCYIFWNFLLPNRIKKTLMHNRTISFLIKLGKGSTIYIFLLFSFILLYLLLNLKVDVIYYLFFIVLLLLIFKKRALYLLYIKSGLALIIISLLILPFNEMVLEKTMIFGYLFILTGILWFLVNLVRRNEKIKKK